MSGVTKGIKKIFKKTNAALKKLWKNKIVRIIVIAIVVYFTAGLALGAMGSVTAASMPGIAGAASTMGITSGAFAAGAGTAGMTAGMTAAQISAATAGVAEGEAVGSVLAASAGGGEAATLGAAVSSVGAEAAPLVASEAAAGAAGEAASSGLINGGMEAAGVVESGANAALANGNTAINAMGEGLTQSIASNAGQAATQGLAQNAASQTFLESLAANWGALEPTTKMLVGQGVMGLGKGALGMYQSSQAEQEREDARKEAIRLGRVPDLTGWTYAPRDISGLINGNRGGG